MMSRKKLFTVILTGITALMLLAGCASDADSDKEDSVPADTQSEEADTAAEESAEAEDTPDTAGTEDPDDSEKAAGNVLIAYFSVPEDINTSGIDADAGASVVVKDGEKLGNVQYMAQTIQSAVGGDLFRIETAEEYPLDHDPLVDQAADEQDENARPELSTHIENPDQYDTILLGYPNWWGDMPQALYTFLEEYDFSGKTIIPFCPHGGSGFSGTERTIAELQPKADVSSDGLSISRNDVADSEKEVTEWAKGLGISR